MKKGVVFNGQTIILISNGEIEGLKNKDKIIRDKFNIGTHASSYLKQWNTTEGIDNLYSQFFSEDATPILQKDFDSFRFDLEKNGIKACNITMISIGQNLSKKEYVQIVKESIEIFKELTNKNFNFKFVIHKGKEIPHAHIFKYSNNIKDLLFTREQIQLLKEIVADKTKNLFEMSPYEK